MATIERPPALADDMAELQKAVDDRMKGIRDSEAMDRAAEEMDAGREEIRQRFGELDMAVELTDPDE